MGLQRLFLLWGSWLQLLYMLHIVNNLRKMILIYITCPVWMEGLSDFIHIAILHMLWLVFQLKKNKGNVRLNIIFSSKQTRISVYVSDWLKVFCLYTRVNELTHYQSCNVPIQMKDETFINLSSYGKQTLVSHIK